MPAAAIAIITLRRENSSMRFPLFVGARIKRLLMARAKPQCNIFSFRLFLFVFMGVLA